MNELKERKKEFWQKKLVNAREQLKKEPKNLLWLGEYNDCMFKLKKIWLKENNRL